jgi:hypothetical protein
VVVEDWEIVRVWEETYLGLHPEVGVLYSVDGAEGFVDDALDGLARCCREALGDEYLRLLRRHLAENLAGRALPDVPASRRLAACDILTRLLVAAAENTVPSIRGHVYVTLVFAERETGQRWMEELGAAVEAARRQN